MRKIILLLTALFISPFPILSQQSKARIHTEYSQGNNQTLVSANTLFVSNTPSQFVQLQLRGVIWGKRPLFPAEEVLLEFHSFSETRLFKKSESQVVDVYIGGQTKKLTRLEYKTPSSEVAQSVLPSKAMIKGKVSLEVLIARVTPEFIQTLIDAPRIEFQLGDTKFALDADQRGILREFGTYVLPTDVVPQPGDGVTLIEPAIPTELANASLSVVLKWLRDKLEREAVSPLNGRMVRFQPDEFSTCQVKFRMMTMDGGRPVVRRLYALDLADLNPELVKAASYSDRTFLYFRKKSGRHDATIDLYSVKYAAEITAAFKQAVTLCQP